MQMCTSRLMCTSARNFFKKQMCCAKVLSLFLSVYAKSKHHARCFDSRANYKKGGHTFAQHMCLKICGRCAPVPQLLQTVLRESVFVFSCGLCGNQNTIAWCFDSRTDHKKRQTTLLRQHMCLTNCGAVCTCAHQHRNLFKHDVAQKCVCLFLWCVRESKHHCMVF